MTGSFLTLAVSAALLGSQSVELVGDKRNVRNASHTSIDCAHFAAAAVTARANFEQGLSRE